MDSVIITVGGIDVTEEAYNESTGAVEINYVSGNIIITAVALDLPDPPVE